ncbi:hypothetical protein LJC34_07575 [Oscillospiraceae bacterium OttesenSCG-928-G22]|nr:hypothetical protein [Oscillospiraceae bacterium OttesenSCG-928-G22]
MDNQPEKRERAVIYVTPETARRWNEGVLLTGSKSKSDFAGRAIDFYTGYLAAQEHTGYLADIFSKIMTAIVRSSETRLARLHFKSIVEQAKLAHTVASLNDIDDESLRALHIRCVDEVKRINGVVRFEDAVHYQHGDD